ncbi:glyscosyl transferase, group 1 family protein [Blastopirellula marina DSM 3645]|uniref:Glyscosyl transferase, group 1 family protein n=2 Tax=Blastopirellula marina TaxID=124 RepID=A4A134_9BACT|nr:glyscosyl transferase, group 1 family protein [Blastopirellula marina DSM 3645]
MARLVTLALREKGHEVTVVRSEVPDNFKGPTHDFDCPILQWNQQDKVHAAIVASDFVVYHIGNHLGFHQGCLNWLTVSPGIVCLHDYYLGNLFYGAYDTERETGKAIVRNWYGEEISQRYFTYKSSDEFISQTNLLAPMTEWICSMAVAVLTHSGWAIDRVLRSCPGPVNVVPLAYEALTDVVSESITRSEDEVFRLITIGHVNPNKRVRSVIQAIAASPRLREKIEYELVGFVEESIRIELIRFATKHNVRLKIAGEVDDTALATAIRRADAISCLRSPILESGSASVIEAMLEGKPTLVTNAAHYSEIPDGCVVKIRPENEIADITAALEQLYSNPQQSLIIGARAKEYARVNHSASQYADAVVEIAEQCLSSSAALDALRFYSSVAQAWGAPLSMVSHSELLNPLKIFED